MIAEPPRRLSLLYQLYLTSQASRRFMSVALAGTGMSGEEYAICSYLFANGPRPLSTAARDLGLPITTLAGLFDVLVEAGDVERVPHPSDGRVRLLSLTASGRARRERVIPRFTAAYRRMLGELEAADVDPEAVYTALDQLREGITTTREGLEVERTSLRYGRATRPPLRRPSGRRPGSAPTARRR